MKVSKVEKVSFFASVVGGLISYGYFITNHFLTYDSMWNLYSDQNVISSGRQFLMYACKISSDYDLPWLNGLLAIFYLAINACLLVRLFDVKNKTAAIIIAGITVMFPSVTSTFAYTYTVDGYMLAVLLATVSVYLAVKYKYGFIAGIFTLGFSIGIYQAYFSYAIILCILVLLILILKGEDPKRFGCLTGKMAVMGILAYVFYVVSLKLMLMIQKVELSGYQGTEAVAGIPLSKIPMGLKTAFWSFINFARWENVLTTTIPMKIAFVLFSVVGIAEFMYLFVRGKLYKKVLNVVLMLIVIIAIPFGATTVAILSPNTYVHLLIRMPWALLITFPVILGDIIVSEEKLSVKAKNVAKAGFACAFVMLFEFAVVANIVGYNMNERYEKTYATCLRIVDRLEQTEGYETGMPVAILGGYPNQYNYPSTDITAEDLSGYFGVSGELCVNSTEKYAEFMSHYLNVTITPAGSENEESIVSKEEFKEMSNFPSADSIKCIDGIWVIRING